LYLGGVYDVYVRLYGMVLAGKVVDFIGGELFWLLRIMGSREC
jgi:hypothetical protein